MNSLYFSDACMLKFPLNLIRKMHSKIIREKFIEYFKKENHIYVRSSPVIPFQDPSLAFVNAGMNQFKDIILGNKPAVYSRVVNSQKCIRIGGKHNDLNFVGTDGHHHTFFEMLGNWSFGDYFKEKACYYAWDVLTREYNIKPENLYVTYFSGSEYLKPDIQCAEIWKKLGVKNSHISPSGPENNFWEMGIIGPCGVCSEIFYKCDIQSSGDSNPNKNMLELWNLVFMEYDRLEDGSLTPLKISHVDTGMGLERLAAVLQHVDSTYDTDLFLPLIEYVVKFTGIDSYHNIFGSCDHNGKNTAIRMIVDYCKMATIAMADGMFPDEKTSKLRNIIRRAIWLCREKLNCYTLLLPGLAEVVAEIYGDVYPEVFANINNAKEILKYETHFFHHLNEKGLNMQKQLTSTEQHELLNFYPYELPGVVPRYQEFRPILIKYQNELPADIAFELLDRYCLSNDVLDRLANALNLKIPWEECQIKREERKLKEKIKFTEKKNQSQDLIQLSHILHNLNVPKTTLISQKDFNYQLNDYEFPSHVTKVEAISLDKKNLSICINEEKFAVLIVSSSNFYFGSEECAGDQGVFITETGTFQINDTQLINNYVYHLGKTIKGYIKTEQQGELQLNQEKHLKVMANHTAVHLLHGALRKALNVVFPQKSYANSENFEINFHIYGNKLNEQEITEVMNIIDSVIFMQLPIQQRKTSLEHALNIPNIYFHPLGVYHDNITVVSISTEKLQSFMTSFHQTDIEFKITELCHELHLHNTSDLGHICLTNISFPGEKTYRSLQTITGVTGQSALLAKNNGENLMQEIDKLNKLITKTHNMIRRKQIFDNLLVKECKVKMNNCVELMNQNLLPILIKLKSKKEIDELKKLLDVICRKESLIKILNAFSSAHHQPYFVHVICDKHKEAAASKLLTKAIYNCTEKPSCIFFLSQEGNIKGRCIVPKKIQTECNGVSALNWMKTTDSIIKGYYKELDTNGEMCIFGTLKQIPEKNHSIILEQMKTNILQFAEKHFNKRSQN